MHSILQTVVRGENPVYELLWVQGKVFLCCSLVEMAGNKTISLPTKQIVILSVVRPLTKEGVSKYLEFSKRHDEFTLSKFVEYDCNPLVVLLC